MADPVDYVQLTTQFADELKKLTTDFAGVLVSKSNVLTAVGQVMKKVETFSKLNGMQKHQLVLGFLQGLIKDNKTLSEVEKAFCMAIVSSDTGSDAIHLVMSATSLGINAARILTKGCCG